MSRIINGSEAVANVVRTLSRCAQVRRYDEEGQTAAGSLAYCFDSLEGHFREFLENQLPRLTQGEMNDQEVCDLLYEIGATFGQVLWHIKLPKFFGYLQDGLPAPEELK